MVKRVRHGRADRVFKPTDENTRLILRVLDAGRNVPRVKHEIVARRQVLGGGPLAKAPAVSSIGCRPNRSKDISWSRCSSSSIKNSSESPMTAVSSEGHISGMKP